MLIPVVARIYFAGGGSYLAVVISTQTSSTYETYNLDENFTYRLYRSHYYNYAYLTRAASSLQCRRSILETIVTKIQKIYEIVVIFVNVRNRDMNHIQT